MAYKTTDVPIGTTDWGSYADQIKQSGADTLYTALATTDNIALVNALKQAGAPIQHIVLSGGYDPRVAGHLGRSTARSFGIEFKPLETTPEPPGITEFKKGMAKYAPDVAVNQSAGGRLALGQHPHRGHQGGRRLVPDPQGVHQQPAPREGLHGRRVLRPDQLPGSVQQAVRLRLLRAGRGRGSSLRRSTAEPICGDFVKNNKLVAPTPAATTPPTTVAAG